MKNKPFLAIAFAILAACSSCGNDGPSVPSTPSEPDKPNVQIPINIGTTISRATETAFENGDQMGLFVVNRNADGSAVPLKPSGNYVDNMLYTYVTSWNPASALYWKDAETHADFYMYYPYTSTITSVDAMPFKVNADQSSEAAFKASDLIVGSTLDVVPTASPVNIMASVSPIRLTFKHIMSKLKIRLIKGEDFEGDMPTTATVYIHNTVPTATVDLQAGVATRYVKGTRQTITARQDGDTSYSAIIVPQRIDNRQPLIEVVMNGVSYLFESKFQFKPGTEHLVNLIISDNPDKVKIDIGGEIQDWQ